MATSSSSASSLESREVRFDNFMTYFSSPEMFGAELYALHSMDGTEEGTKLLADCIEANWIIFSQPPLSSSSSKQQSISAASMNNGNDTTLGKLMEGVNQD